MGIDAISAFVQFSLGYNLSPDGRSGGVVNGSVMGLAMLLTFTFPLALIAIFDKSFPKYVRQSALFSLIGMLLGMWGNQAVVLGYLMVLMVYLLHCATPLLTFVIYWYFLWLL